MEHERYHAHHAGATPGWQVGVSGGAKRSRRSAESGSFHAAVVAAGARVVQMQVLDALVLEEAPDMLFDVLPVDDVGTHEHGRRIVCPDGLEPGPNRRGGLIHRRRS